MRPVWQHVLAVVQRAEPGLLCKVSKGSRGPRQQRRNGQRSDIHFLIDQRVVSRVRGSFITRIEGKQKIAGPFCTF